MEEDGQPTPFLHPQPLRAKKFFWEKERLLGYPGLRIERFLIQDRPGKGSHCLDLPSCTNKFFFLGRQRGRRKVECFFAGSFFGHLFRMFKVFS